MVANREHRHSSDGSRSGETGRWGRVIAITQQTRFVGRPKYMVLLLAGALTLLGIPQMAAGQVASPPTYQVTQLGLLPGETSVIAKGINEEGQVVGWSGSPPSAFLWTAGAMQELPPLPGHEAAFGDGVNGIAQVAGESGPAFSAVTHAVRWVNGVPQDLGTLGGGSGDSSTARDINDLGHVVGDSSIAGKTHAFIFTDQGGMTDITTGFDDAHAYGINEIGQVTGYANSRAFRWQAGTFEDLGIPQNFAFSFGFDINEAGQVAGSTTSATGISQRLVRWTDGVGWEILGGVGKTNVAWAINDSGTVVGEGVPVGGLITGVVFFDGLGLFDLDDLVEGIEWNVLKAYDINNAGQIAALAHNTITGETTAVRLDPVDAGTGGPAVHVGSISITLKFRKGTASATSTVQTLDQDGKAVIGATVTADWLVNGTVVSSGATTLTGTTGTARFSGKFSGVTSGAVVEFCVTGISHESFTYVPDANVETCDQAVVP